MAIGNAVQRDGWVYVYDENGNQTKMIPSGYGPEDGLKGYTSSCVNIRRDGWILSFDEQGNQLRAVQA